MQHDRSVRRDHLHLAGPVILLDQIHPIGRAMWAAAAAIGLGRRLQRRSLFEKHRNQGAIDLVGQVLPLDELFPRQRHRFIRGNHFVEDGLKDLTEPFTGLLPIRQRRHGLLDEFKGSHHNLLYPTRVIPARRKRHAPQLVPMRLTR